MATPFVKIVLSVVGCVVTGGVSEFTIVELDIGVTVLDELCGLVCVGGGFTAELDDTCELGTLCETVDELCGKVELLLGSETDCGSDSVLIGFGCGREVLDELLDLPIIL